MSWFLTEQCGQNLTVVPCQSVIDRAFVVTQKMQNQRVSFLLSCLVDHTLLLDELFLLLFHRLLLLIWLFCLLCCWLLLWGFRFSFLLGCGLLSLLGLFGFFRLGVLRSGLWSGLLGRLLGEVVFVIIVIDLDFKLFSNLFNHIHVNFALWQKQINCSIILCREHVWSDHGEPSHYAKNTYSLSSNYQQAPLRSHN